MPAKCRFCDKTYDEFEQLRSHARKQHEDEFSRIKRWLKDDVDWRLESEAIKTDGE